MKRKGIFKTEFNSLTKIITSLEIEKMIKNFLSIISKIRNNQAKLINDMDNASKINTIRSQKEIIDKD